MKRYEQFPHTADIGVRVFSRDKKASKIHLQITEK